MGKVECDSLKEYLAGRGDRPRALLGRKDPRRAPGGQPSDKPPWEIRGWDSSKGDKPCPGCGDGKHWWAACPTFPKPNKNPSLVSAKKIAKAKKAKAAAAASTATDGEEAPPTIRANVARREHDEYTPIEDILADYVEDNPTTMARSLVARLHIAGGPPPDPPPSPADLNYDESSDDEDDQCADLPTTSTTMSTPLRRPRLRQSSTIQRQRKSLH